MHIRFQSSRKIETSEIPDYVPDMDNYLALIHYVCDILQESGQCRFEFSGFGKASWPLDIATDLATLLEDLPNALSHCKSGSDFSLELYEQGVEARLEFVRNGAYWRVSCYSSSEVIPNNEHEQLSGDQLLSQLTSLLDGFVGCIEPILDSASPWADVAWAWLRAKSARSG